MKKSELKGIIRECIKSALIESVFGNDYGLWSDMFRRNGYISDETHWEWSKRLDNGLMVFQAHYGGNEETMAYEIYFYPFVKVDKKLGGLYKQRSVAPPVTYDSSDAIDFGVGLFKLDTPSIISDVEKKLIAAEEKAKTVTPEYDRKEVGPIDKLLNKGSLTGPSKDLYKDPADYKDSFLAKEDVIRNIVREEIKSVLKESTAKILEPEFGGGNDSDFLKVVWYMDTNQLEELLKTSINDLTWLKKHSRGVLNVFNRRDAQIVKNRIQFIKQIIKSKKSNPDYVPDIHKRGDIEIDEKMLRELKEPGTVIELKKIAKILDSSANNIKGNLVYKATNSKDRIKEIERAFELFKEKAQLVDLVREEIQNILQEKKRKKKRKKNPLPNRRLGYIGIGPWHVHDQSIDMGSDSAGDGGGGE